MAESLLVGRIVTSCPAFVKKTLKNHKNIFFVKNLDFYQPWRTSSTYLCAYTFVYFMHQCGILQVWGLLSTNVGPLNPWPSTYFLGHFLLCSDALILLVSLQLITLSINSFCHTLSSICIYRPVGKLGTTFCTRTNIRFMYVLMVSEPEKILFRIEIWP